MDTFTAYNIMRKKGSLKRLCHQKLAEQWPRKELCISELGLKIFFQSPLAIFFRSQFSDQNSFPVPIFECKFLFRSSLLRYTFLFRSPILRHTLSLDFLGKCKFLFISKVLEEKNHAMVISGQASITYAKIVFGDGPFKAKHAHVIPPLAETSYFITIHIFPRTFSEHHSIRES